MAKPPSRPGVVGKRQPSQAAPPKVAKSAADRARESANRLMKAKTITIYRAGYVGTPYVVAISPDGRTLSTERFGTAADARSIATKMAKKTGWRVVDEIAGSGGRG